MTRNGTTAIDPRLPSRQQLDATRQATIRLSGQVPADPRVAANGRVRPMRGYDTGFPPPQRPEHLPGADLGRRETSATVAAVVERTCRHYGYKGKPRQLVLGVTAVCEWLTGHPGETWEERWLSSGLDAAPAGWLDAVAEQKGIPYKAAVRGLNALLLAHVLRPSYAWLLEARQVNRMLPQFLPCHEPEALTRLQGLASFQSATLLQQVHAQLCLAKLLLRTGKPLSLLRGDDLLHYADIVRMTGRSRREHLAWELLVALGPLAGEPPTLRAAWAAKGNSRQHSVETLVDRYGLPASGMRDLLVDYLNELKPSMDYGSLESLAYRLIRLFWAEVLQINPGQKDLHLDAATGMEWRERLKTTLDGVPRLDIHSVLFSVRALYRDLAEWSHEEPHRWAVWVAPCPVPRLESKAASKAKRLQQARIQDRTRMLVPQMPNYLAAAEKLREDGESLLQLAQATPHGEQFEFHGLRYERHAPKAKSHTLAQTGVWVRLRSKTPEAKPFPEERGLVSVTRVESDGFWGWAVASTLKETGLRIEELLELTQMSLRHYTAPDTNTIVPLLHVIPSKTDTERLVPMSPDLVHVLVQVQRRAKGSTGTIPLSVRYDPSEKTFSNPFPHLFARKVGARQEVLSAAYVRKLLIRIGTESGLNDAGQPRNLSPHDFRRLFSTELVSSGLPLHIVSSILGHLNLETTRGYTAVFPEDVIQAHHSFIERRRTLRPDGEMRSSTPDEWDEFERHFLLRKVALGNCHRPYGTPCIHEHACTKCRFLQIDPSQIGRIEQMTDSAAARLTEAREKVWLGEVAALEDSLQHLRSRKLEAERLLSEAQPKDNIEQ
jgi:integrase